MRKATWGTMALGLWALSLGYPIDGGLDLLHRVMGIFLLIGYLLISMDPPEQSKRQRDLFIAGIVCSIASFLLAFAGVQALLFAARVLAVAVAALPLWLVAGPVRSGFIAAGILALATVVPQMETAGPVVVSLYAYVLAFSAFSVAALFERPALLSKGDRKPPRIVTARDVVFLTPEEKAERLARLEKRFQAGEIPEHKYWDLRQEIESR